MNSLGVCHIVVVVIVVVVSALVIDDVQCGGGKSAESYVVKPKVRDYDPPALDWIRRQVGEQGAKGPQEVRQFLAEVRDKIEQKQELPAPYTGQKVILKSFLSSLVLMADDDKLECTYFIIGDYIKLVDHVFGRLTAIMGQPRDDTQQDAALFNFLQHYGRIKFAKCTRKFFQKYLDLVAEMGPEVETILDELVASQAADRSSSATTTDNKQLAELASKVDLVRGLFDAKFMKKAADKHVDPKKAKAGGKAGALFELIDSKCQRYTNRLEQWLNVVNVNRLLNPDTQIPDRVVKLVEYERLCHQFEGSDKEDQIKAHMQEQLASKFKISNFFCASCSNQFLKWTKKKAGLEVVSYTFKGHVDQTSINSHLIIHNVTIDMHGKYKCLVRTDLGFHEMEHDVIVISQASCKLNDWRVVSEQTKCREMFKLDCRNMFPKPVPSCGLWNDKLDKFIRSVMVDISEEPNKETYRVKYVDKFELRHQENNTLNAKYSDLLQYAGHLIFKCDIVVPDTSWRLSIAHKMFDYSDGCLQDPLETIERMRLNYSHYTTQRMQKAGYLLDNKQLDEIEMLTSNLKYEIIPLSSILNHHLHENTNQIMVGNNNHNHNNNNNNNKNLINYSNNVDFNCWQKPRVGSYARLSCATNTNQVRLVGTNLLECRPNGWVPVTESSFNIKKTNDLLKRKQQQQQQQQMASRRPSRSENSPEGSNARDEKQREELSTQSSVPTARGNPNDLENTGADEEDNDDSRNIIDHNSHLPTTERENSIPRATTTTTTTTMAKPMTTTTTPATTTTMPETILTYEQDETPPEINLTPAQLASLLPSCVSTNPRHRNNRPPDRNRLPLRDGAVLLEAYSTQNGAKLPGRHRGGGDQDDYDDTQKWYSFFLSSGSQASHVISHQTVATCLLMVSTLTLLMGELNGVHLARN